MITNNIPKMCRLSLVTELMGLCRSSIYRLIKDRLFPRPVKIGTRASRWPSNEIEAILAAHAAGMSDEKIKNLVQHIENSRVNRGLTI